MVWISNTFLTSRAGYKTMGNFSNGFPVYTARAIAVIGGSYWLYVFPCCNVDLKERRSSLTTGVSWASIHVDIIKWTHFPRYWPFVRGIHRSPMNSPHKGQWRGALMFSLICVWINGWVSNREAGDLRRHRAHYDVTVISQSGRRSYPHDLVQSRSCEIGCCNPM